MSTFFRPAVLLACAALTGCGAQDTGSMGSADSRPMSKPTTSRPHTMASKPSSGLHAPFDALLAKHVRNERVDYVAWRDSTADSAALDTYLDALAKVEVGALSKDEQLAFYFNLYNATMVDTILDRVKDGYSTSENDFGVFKEKLVRLGGDEVSLDHIENGIVRKQFDEPRLHVAFVCGARSCPPLLPRAYRAADLDQVLEANMKRFVTDGQRNKIGEKLELSQLFNWYKADFGGDAGVLEYVARYAGVDVAGKDVSFLEYSWKLNIVGP